jgi:hypothetical protein
LRIYGIWLGTACALLAGCAPGGIILGGGEYKSPLFNSDLSRTDLPRSTALQDLLARTDDPLPRIPEHIAVEPPPGSWTNRFVTQALKIVDAEKIAGTEVSGTNPGIRAAYHALLGNTEAIADLEKNMEAGNGDYYTASTETLTRRCEDRSSAITLCETEVQNQIYYATLALVMGHTEKAEARYSNADRYRSDALRQLNGPYRTAVGLEIWFNARILYLLLAERFDDAIAEMKALVGERVSNYPAEDILDLWSRMGHSRALAKLTLTASRDSILDDVVFSTVLYRDFDAAVLREEGPDALTARLQVIGALMGAYEDAGALWRNHMTVSLECRLGLVALLEGDQAKADALYAKTKEVFMRSEADLGWEVGLCLYRMAPQLGKSADQPALIAQMQRHYEESKKGMAANTQEFMNGAAGDESLVAHTAQFGRINALIAGKPQAYAFLDEARFRQSAAAALDLTKEVRKTDPTFGNRDTEVILVVNYVLDRYLYFGE